jgi:hypothetical protein
MKRLNSWGNSRHFRCRWMLLAGLALTSLYFVACNLNPQPEPPLGVPGSTMGGPTAATGGAGNPGTSETGGTAGVGGDVALGMDNGGAGTGAMNSSAGGSSAGGTSATAGTSGMPVPPLYPSADAGAPLPNDGDAGADGGDSQ